MKWRNEYGEADTAFAGAILFVIIIAMLLLAGGFIGGELAGIGA